jgi:hypothetical protein
VLNGANNSNDKKIVSLFSLQAMQRMQVVREVVKQVLLLPVSAIVAIDTSAWVFWLSA